MKLITMTRHAARRLRAVFRRSVLGISHKGLIPPLVLHAEGHCLRAQYRYHDLAVEYTEPGSLRQLDSISVALEALGDVEGRDNSAVELESVEPDRIVVRWQDRGIPRTREYPVTPFGKIAPFPETPTAWTSISTDLLTALAEASEICTADSARYALDCIQLRGNLHGLIATDGCQLLVRSGFNLPWDGDLLIRASPVFACKAFPRDQPIQIARTDGEVVLRIGAWTLWHAIQKDARFPRVEEAIPDVETVTTRLVLDPEDAAFLKEALDRLPGAEVLHGPITIDCNGKVALRARGNDPNPITELVLNRSAYSGSPIRISTSRAYVGRALAMGFRELAFTKAEQPVVCREPHRIYAWQPLNGGSAIDSQPESIRIESIASSIEAAHIITEPGPARRLMIDVVAGNGQQTKPPLSTNGSAAGESPGTTLEALLEDTQALHSTLTEARLSVSRLITGLRRHRKQSRLLSETLRSLRQLKLTELAE
jgi:hypothetical protein